MNFAGSGVIRRASLIFILLTFMCAHTFIEFQYVINTSAEMHKFSSSLQVMKNRLAKLEESHLSNKIDPSQAGQVKHAEDEIHELIAEQMEREHAVAKFDNSPTANAKDDIQKQISVLNEGNHEMVHAAAEFGEENVRLSAKIEDDTRKTDREDDAHRPASNQEGSIGLTK